MARAFDEVIIRKVTMLMFIMIYNLLGRIIIHILSPIVLPVNKGDGHWEMVVFEFVGGA
mgnify:FL=1